MINVGDYVTRKSHNNDIIFKVIQKENKMCYLKGIEIRLVADSNEEDLIKLKPNEIKYDEGFCEKVINSKNMDRDNFFYMPGKILHIDGDPDYLKKCINFYKQANVLAYGKNIKEKEIPNKILELLKEIKPDILIITGHDAYYMKTGKYKNSDYFMKSVRIAREYEKSNENLLIIAGACQSDYEGLIKAGSTFASSPKRINIHALDPAVIGVSLSLSEKSKEIDLLDVLSKTKYGFEGIGGIRSKGTMYTGYPRNEAK